MFTERKAKKNEKKPNIEPGTSQNRVNEGTEIKGDIVSSGFFRIDGKIVGNIKTPSKVVVGKTGVIIGTLHCESADVEGYLEGDIHVSELLILRSTAQIDGDLVVGKLSVEPGAVINASCIMKGGKVVENSKAIKSSQKELSTDKNMAPSRVLNEN